jgi:hypothetical protein
MEAWNGYIGVFDDIIPIDKQEIIKSDMLESKKFPWFYQPFSAFALLDEFHANFPINVHVFSQDYEEKSSYYPNIEFIAWEGAKRAGFHHELTQILQARAYFQYPLSEEFQPRHLIDSLHCDSDLDHLVVLYYVVDSDGDTILTDKRREGDNYVEKTLRLEDHTIIKRVTPKQGRALVFDGRYYHTTQQPQRNIRSVINFNLT